jgi:RHS repeat-associated protein
LTKRALLTELPASVPASFLGDGLAQYTPVVSERRGGESRFFHAGMKSFDAQTDELGAVAATRRYDASGNTLAGGWTSPFAHGGPWGYQTDANGLQLLGHRWYDQTLARFLTRDPAEDGRNWHTYCWNNPASGVDPDGLARIPPHHMQALVQFVKQGHPDLMLDYIENFLGLPVPETVRESLSRWKPGGWKRKPEGTISQIVKHLEGLNDASKRQHIDRGKGVERQIINFLRDLFKGKSK